MKYFCQEIKPNLIKPSYVISSLEEQGKEEPAKAHHGDVMSKIYTVGNSVGQTIQFLQQIGCNEERERERGEGTYT